MPLAIAASAYRHKAAIARAADASRRQVVAGGCRVHLRQSFGL